MAAVIANGRVPADKLLEVKGLVVLGDDLVAVVTALNLVVLLAVLGDAVLVRAGHGGGRVGGRAGDGNAVVVVDPDAGAVLADGRVPAGKVAQAKRSEVVHNLLAGVALLRLVVLGALAGDAVLGRAGLAGVGAGGRGGSAGNADADIVVNPEAGAVTASSRVPLEAIWIMLGQAACDAGIAQYTYKSEVENAPYLLMMASQVSPLWTLYHFWPVVEKLGFSTSLMTKVYLQSLVTPACVGLGLLGSEPVGVGEVGVPGTPTQT